MCVCCVSVTLLVLLFMFFFITSLAGSRLTLQVLLSIGKTITILFEGVGWDLFTMYNYLYHNGEEFYTLFQSNLSYAG